MAKPSTDTATEHNVAVFRGTGLGPKRMTLRFLALLTKRELADLASGYKAAMDNWALPHVPHAGWRRFYRTRWLRIQSERRQRGHIK